MPIRLRFLLTTVVFMALVGMLIIGILVVAAVRFPKPPQMQMASMNQPMEELSFWERFKRNLDFRMHPPATARDQAVARQIQRSRPADGKANSAMPPGSPALQMPSDQLAMREVANAELIRWVQFDTKLEDGVKRMRTMPVSGNFVNYEFARLKAQVLLQNYVDGGYPPGGLPELHRTALAVASDPNSIFDDYYVAGYACLAKGDPKGALSWLTKADEAWPSKGNGYNDVYLMLLLTHCALGDEAEVVKELGDFKENYQDWLYLEVYMPEIEHIHRVYPGSPLMDVVKGRSHYLVNDYAAAETAWKRARAASGLGAAAAKQVDAWLADIQKDMDL